MQAVHKAYHSLHTWSDEKNGKAQEVLVEAFKPGVDASQVLIRRLEQEAKPFKGDETVWKRRTIALAYDSLNNLYNEINKLPENLRIAGKKKKEKKLDFTYKDYSSKLTEAQQLLTVAANEAAKMHYQEGLYHASFANSIDHQQAAAEEFKKAQTFVKNYKDAAQRQTKAREVGTKRIALIPFVNKSHGIYGLCLSE